MNENPPRPPEPWTPPRELPEQFESERLIIRWWRASDAEGMLQALDIDRSSFAPWLPWVANDNRDIAQCIYQIERQRREAVSGVDYTLGLFDRSTGAVVGGTGFHRMDNACLQAEIGYWVRPDRRGQGLCTEAVASMLSWGLTPQRDGGWGFRRIEILCAGANRASQRVPERLGLRREVIRRRARWVSDHGWDDMVGWGVLAEEWDCAAQTLRHEPG